MGESPRQMTPGVGDGGIEIINHLPAAMVWPTALELAKDIGAARPARENPRRERARTLLKALVARLSDQPTPEGDRVLNHLFDQKLLPLGELPPRLQETISAREFADTYLANEP